MQVFKFFLLIIIWGSSSFIGILISRKYVNRVYELKEFKNALNVLETKIKFTYEPLGEIFKEIEKNLTNNIATIFSNACNNMNTTSVDKAWENAIDSTVLNLNKEDINILKELGHMLRQNRC